MWNNRYNGYGWTPPKVHITPVPAELLHDNADQREATAFATQVEKTWTATAHHVTAAAGREAAAFATAAASDDPKPKQLHGPG